MRRRFLIRVLLGAVVALWLVGVGAGFARLMHYSTTPGDERPAPSDWPVGSGHRPEADRANLVLFAHPHCGCTRATIQQLEEIAARCPDLVTIHVLFVRPREGTGDWTQTELWRQAAAIPGAMIIDDAGGAEARRFGATTSGTVLLYRRDGRLMLHGGVTDARGQEGASAGCAAIISLLTTGAAELAETPVFGCPLFDPTSSTDQETQSCRKD